MQYDGKYASKMCASDLIRASLSTPAENRLELRKIHVAIRILRDTKQAPKIIVSVKINLSFTTAVCSRTFFNLVQVEYTALVILRLQYQKDEQRNASEYLSYRRFAS